MRRRVRQNERHPPRLNATPPTNPHGSHPVHPEHPLTAKIHLNPNAFPIANASTFRPARLPPPEERHLTVRLPLFSGRRNHLLHQLEPNRISLVLKHLHSTLTTLIRVLKPRQYLAAANLGFVPRSIPVPPSMFQVFMTSHPQMAHLQRTISSQTPPSQRARLTPS